MPPESRLRSAGRWVAVGAGLAAIGYATYVGRAWARYGHPAPPRPEEQDELLDRFMPAFDVVERHHVEVGAPAAVTLEAARTMDLAARPLVRAIFKGRELILGSRPDTRERPKGLVDDVLSLGWAILADVPDRELVVGAVTRPWEPDVTFRPVPPDVFADFRDADYVKIAWTLRADPIGAHTSIFRTETRAVATDAAARAKFRVYWSCLSPGISLIRRLSLRPLKADAERRAAAGAPPAPHPVAAGIR
jgi:hypothetical protein